MDAHRPQTTRRSVHHPVRRGTGWLLGAVAAVALLCPALADAATAKPADAFVDSIGVNTHTYYTGTVYYQRFNEWKAKLAELGVRHIRENLVPNRSDQYQRLNELGAMGVKLTLILGDPTNGISGLETLLSIAKNNLRSSLAALEGPNEFDLSGRSNWRDEFGRLPPAPLRAGQGRPLALLAAGHRPLDRSLEQPAGARRHLQPTRLRQHPFLPRRLLPGKQPQLPPQRRDGEFRLQAGDGHRNRLPHGGELDGGAQTCLRAGDGYLRPADVPRVLPARRGANLLLRTARRGGELR